MLFTCFLFACCVHITASRLPVTVLDILPHRVASVYCFYDPDLRHMEWGKFTALYEIYLTAQVSGSPAINVSLVHSTWSTAECGTAKGAVVRCQLVCAPVHSHEL